MFADQTLTVKARLKEKQKRLLLLALPLSYFKTATFALQPSPGAWLCIHDTWSHLTLTCPALCGGGHKVDARCHPDMKIKRAIVLRGELG